VAAVTALVAAVMTILMGVVGRYPFAVATGLGLNAFVTFSVATQMSWADAMGLVVLEGIVIAVLVLVGLRTAIFHAIPMELKTAISVGIGLFIALIGLVDAGFVRRTDAGPVPVQLGVGGELQGWPTVVFVIGLLLTRSCSPAAPAARSSSASWSPRSSRSWSRRSSTSARPSSRRTRSTPAAGS
jgi:AGZA family xanthine/uracil permease-like MFS transporter